MSASDATAPLTPARLTIPDAVAVLRKAGSQHITEEALRADLAAGAPVNPDGTIHLLHYVAWLAKEVCHAD
jgi:hypothetical protein